MNQPFETKEVVIKNLVTEGLQIRVEMNEDCINEYADIYRTWNELDDDDKLPPVIVFNAYYRKEPYSMRIDTPYQCALTPPLNAH